MKLINFLVVLTAVALATAACSEEAVTPGAATPTAFSSATPSTRPTPQRTASTPPPKPNAKKQAALDEQLIAAAWKNDFRRARALIDQGADVNAKDNTVQSAYLISTSEGYLELLNLTLRHGADVDSKDSFNGTALIRAADRGHAYIAGR
jgi:ankyrin repeat protein